MGLSTALIGGFGRATSALKNVGSTGVKLGVGAAVGAAGAAAYMSSDKKSLLDKSKKDGDQSKGVSEEGTGDEDQAVGLTFIPYPENLGDEQYPHYVNFYINVNSRSKLANDPSAQFKEGTVKRGPEGQGAGTTNVPLAVGKLVGAEEKVAGFIASYKRFKTAISLPLPAEISSSYSMEYGNVSTGGVMGSFLNNIANGQDMLEASSNAASAIAQQLPGHALKVAATGLGGIVGAAGGVRGAQRGAEIGASSVDASAINAIFNKARGQAVNERLEQVFKQVNFRQFAFNYVLAPRDQKEMLNIQKIISMFKEHMHPEPAEDGMFLISPDEFDIEFRFQDKVNKYVHKVRTCALANMSVNYTPVGQYASFRDGAPVMISLQLQFIEMYPLTREDIKKGA